MIICIDSNVIIWGIKKQPTQGQESLVGEAEYFFKWADENNHEIIIPTVVLAEVLAREPDEIRTRYLEVLKQAFIIVDFDTKVALKYAQILHNRFDEVKKLAAAAGVDRQKMKMDHIIVASAIVHGAKCIMSYDKGLKSFSEGFIDVRTFPQPPAPVVDLFSALLATAPAKKQEPIEQDITDEEVVVAIKEATSGQPIELADDDDQPSPPEQTQLLKSEEESQTEAKSPLGQPDEPPEQQPGQQSL